MYTSSSGVNFGIYIPSSSPATNVTGTITAVCAASSGGIGPTVMLSIGGGASYAGQLMNSGASLLTYPLYTDSPRSVIWGDSTSSTSFASLSSTLASSGGTHVPTIYGGIVALQAANPGVYSDVVIATLAY